MKALTQAVYEACSVGTDLWSLLGGRFYKGVAPHGTTYPYGVFNVITDTPDDTFAERLEDVLMQFDLYSSAASSSQVEDCFIALKSLYDRAVLSITGQTCLFMAREQARLWVDEIVTPSGTMEVWRYTVDYRVMVKVG